MGYDIGNVIGNLFFAWANKFYTGGSAETQAALERTIRETCDKTAEKLGEQYDKLVQFPLYKAPAFRKAYLDSVMAGLLRLRRNGDHPPDGGRFQGDGGHVRGGAGAPDSHGAGPHQAGYLSHQGAGQRPHRYSRDRDVPHDSGIKRRAFNGKNG